MFSKIEGQIYFFCGLFIVFICWLILTLYPQLDLAISHMFYDDVERFSASKNIISGFFRKLFIWLILLFYIGVTWCGLKAFKEQKPVLNLDWDRYAFLGACALIGPVLLINILLKGNWGRSRPRHLTEFGETQEFTQFWQYAHQCEDNCSFASGEVTGMAMIFISLSMVVEKPLRYLVLLIGAIITSLVAWFRVAAGAHFTTDALVGVGLMFIIAPLVYCYFAASKKGWIRTLSEKQQKSIDEERIKIGKE